MQVMTLPKPLFKKISQRAIQSLIVDHPSCAFYGGLMTVAHPKGKTRHVMVHKIEEAPLSSLSDDDIQAAGWKTRKKLLKDLQGQNPYLKPDTRVTILRVT